jgi:hypothetical protein
MQTVARLCLVFTAALFAAASEDVSLQACYDGHRWFDLREAIRGKEVHPLYRGAVAAAFNDHKGAEKHLNAAIRGASDPGEAEEALSVLARMYTRLGRSGNIIKQYERVLRLSPERSDIRGLCELFAVFGRYPDQSVGRKQRTTIRWTRRPTGLTIPVSVNDRPVDWIVDTGMNISMLSESEARMLGISVHKLSAKASDLSGATTPIGAAVADKLRIGECDVRNVPLLVLPDSQPPMDELPRGERGIIGLPVLLALGTLRWSADGTFEIGGPSSTGASQTLCFDELLPIVRVEWEGKPLDFVLDTGNVAGTQLWERFAQEHRDLIQERGAKAKEWLATIGGSGYREVIRIPGLRLRIGGLDIALRPANVFLRPVGDEHHHGLLGMDLLSQAREVTIDFRSMSVGLR